ncbi:MAG: Lrp/AsnC family transcriptional regulator [bacterium]|nr:Lrp/AsnC family transcriptional regulator [bacterium]
MEQFDSIDRAILDELQQDASRSIQEIAQAVGLSQNPCWRRIKRLEASGVIERRVAILDPEKVGAGITVFVNIRTNQHNEQWLQRFASGVMAIPEVVELYRMSGEIDYLMKVLVEDIAEYDRIYKELIEVAELNDVSSSFAMERIKCTTAIPVRGERPPC